MGFASLPDRDGKLGVYEILRLLGQGGMGSVYLGRSPDGRRVAVKVIRADLAHDDEFRRRFRSEVSRARQVPPFCTAEVIDADPDHEPPYLVVEYVDGPTLADVVREQGPLAGSALHAVAVATATALTAIHGAGVVHRDFKPANVLLAVGGVKVIDFGIARPVEVTSAHTRADQVVGTVEYMAPERLDTTAGQAVGPAADVFAWGAVMACAASGRTPFAAGSPAATAIRILTQPPDLTGLSGPLRDLVDRALHKNPQARPTAQELLTTLVTGDTGARTGAPGGEAAGSHPHPLTAGGFVVQPPAPGPVTAPMHPAPHVTRTVASPRRRRTVIAIAAAVLALLMVGGITLAVLVHRVLAASRRDTVTVTEEGPSARPATAPPSAARSLAASADTSAIFAGTDKTLIYVPRVDRYVTLPVREDATVSNGTDREALFTLLPLGGNTYMIESITRSPQNRQRCAGVHLDGGKPTSLRSADCSSYRQMLFDITSTGQTDSSGRPTYLITSDFYGEVGWDEGTLRLMVGSTDSNAPRTAFSFIDRGAR